MDVDAGKTLLARFYTPEGESMGPPMSVPSTISVDQLSTLLNDHVLKNEEKMPYSFFLNDEEIDATLAATVLKIKTEALNSSASSSSEAVSDEAVLKIIYQPQAVFRVRTVTRCASSLPGHTEAILGVSFSPDGKRLATASGDTSVRLWDANTETPYHECRSHTNWVLCVRWSPDGKQLASGSMDKTVKLWDPESGDLLGTLSGHKQFITSMDWEPLHVDPECRRLVTASKDGTARVWDATRRVCLFVLTSHTMSVTCVKWGGEGYIYTASQDRTIKVWNATDGSIVRTLVGHGHWVNTMSLNTDYVLRTGAYDHTGTEYATPEEAQARALERWLEVKGKGPELLATGSDDFTIYLWHPSKDKKPLERLTGHSRLINVVTWSPDGHLLASASFDKNIKLWSDKGKYLTTFRGHVGEVYQIAWSSDSRLFLSGSKDSTLKVWDTSAKKLREDLPGHADEVYSVDWSPDGQRVASGSKDRLLKVWRN
jgi:ribosome assembly protein 4